METLVIMRIQGKRIAFPVHLVDRVIWAIQITPLPGQNAKFIGVINVEETIIPVINLRGIIGIPECGLEPDNDIVIVHSSVGLLALVTDFVEGVEDHPDTQLNSASNEMESCAAAILTTDEGLVVVVDPAKLISEQDLEAFRKLMFAAPMAPSV